MWLNKYLCKLNVIESNTCQYGEIETVKHYLLHFSLFEHVEEESSEEKTV